jgi:hypothetical protein
MRVVSMVRDSAKMPRPVPKEIALFDDGGLDFRGVYGVFRE